MHGMKKKRVPRVIRNPITEAIRGAQPITGKDLTDLRAVEIKAMDALANGTATMTDWEWVTDLFNIAECMAKAGIGVELIPIAAKAQVILARTYVSAKQTGKWHLNTTDAWVLREGWEYHDLQRQSVTLNEYRRYLKRVADIRRIGANALLPADLLEQVDGL